MISYGSIANFVDLLGVPLVYPSLSIVTFALIVTLLLAAARYNDSFEARSFLTESFLSIISIYC